MEKLGIALQANIQIEDSSKCKMAKIVIVEDEVIVVYILQKLLKDTCDIIDIVSSGEEAISAVRSSDPDVIIMDIFLRGHLNGIETMEEIRKTSSVPVIYTSCIEDEATIRKALNVKHSRFLQKPISGQDIQACIQELMDRKSQQES